MPQWSWDVDGVLIVPNGSTTLSESESKTKSWNVLNRNFWGHWSRRKPIDIKASCGSKETLWNLLEIYNFCLFFSPESRIDTKNCLSAYLYVSHQISSEVFVATSLFELQKWHLMFFIWFLVTSWCKEKTSKSVINYS